MYDFTRAAATAARWASRSGFPPVDAGATKSSVLEV